MNKKYNNPLATSGARHHGQDLVETNLHDAPTVDLRQKINEGRDARLVIEARRRDRTVRHHDDGDSDRFPAFTTSITDKSYPKDFKPVRIPKYDGKQDPRQWIRCYSIAIEVSEGSNSTKALYFPVALESAPSHGLKASSQTPSTHGKTSSEPSSTTFRDP
jgi:hypothetical protein